MTGGPVLGIRSAHDDKKVLVCSVIGRLVQLRETSVGWAKLWQSTTPNGDRHQMVQRRVLPLRLREMGEGAEASDVRGREIRFTLYISITTGGRPGSDVPGGGTTL